jgi:hemerythrin-like domain-containing protein
MATTLDRLRQEHRDHGRLLDILEAELSAFDAAKAPDFEIMAAIADYFLGYPAACHHPKEDLVYRALLARRPDSAGAVDDIEAEHRANAERVRHFAEAVTNVMRDAEISREAFDHVVRQFVEAQRRHIDREETSLFPLAAEALNDEDWAAIDGRIADADDPLFGAMPEERFASLRRDIEEWESTRFT